MLYCDLQSAKAIYERGDNVTSFLKECFGLDNNSPEIIEIAYDLQAGSYIDSVNRNREHWRKYTSEISDIISKHYSEGDTVLDVGTGEMTTLAGVAASCYSGLGDYFACDISWSRLQKGRQFLQAELGSSLSSKFQPIVADLFSLPFSDNSIDIVWTSHALEPNGGREKEAFGELLRVTRKKLIVFEPYYEKNSPEGKLRMERLGYVREIPKAVEDAGAKCDEIIPISNVSNPLNPTYAFVISPQAQKKNQTELWACPATRLPMEKLQDCYWSDRSLLAYPIIGGIPILRPEAAVLASSMR